MTSALAADLASAVDPVVTFGAALRSDPEGWQAGFLRSVASRVLLLCARQVGKSTSTAVLATHRAVYWPGSLVLCVSPSQRQSDELLGKVKACWRTLGRPVAPAGESAQELRLENGSRVVSLPGTESTTRGFSAADLLLLDEAARISSDVYVGVLPMVALTGRVIALSSPGARSGWFYQAWTGDGSSWERHRVTAEESAQYPPERLAELRQGLSPREFASEFMCEFVGVTHAVFDPAKIAAATCGAPGLFGKGYR